MSQENVEIIRRHYDAFNRGDLNGTLEPFSPEVEFIEDAGVRPDAGAHRGIAAVRAFFQGMWDSAQEVGIDPEEFTEYGDKVIVVARLHGRFRHTGIAGESRFVKVWTVHGGKITRLQLFRDKQKALEAVGLSQQDAHADS
jgi:ketosteroid isomerase-like protein